MTTLPLPEDLLAALLDASGWTANDLHPDYPPAIGWSRLAVQRLVFLRARKLRVFCRFPHAPMEHQWRERFLDWS